VWLTLVAAMDRARDADRLWDAAARLHEAEPWVFDPRAVIARPLTDLMDALRRSRVSQRHTDDAVAWRLISEGLATPDANRAVVRAVDEGRGNARELLMALQAATEAGTPWFPMLRGPKVGPMWVRLLVVPGNATIDDLEVVPVAVDVQVRRITEHLSVASTAGMDLDAARPVIQEAWRQEVLASGAPGPPGVDGTLAALDPALWFWGKWGCSYCEAYGYRRPIGRACRCCDLPDAPSAGSAGG